MKKEEIRREILNLRNHMTISEMEEKSNLIVKKLMGFWEYKEAENILGYAGFGSEVQTQLFLKACLKDGKNVYLPKTTRDTMEFYQIFSWEELRPGFKGILEPVDRKHKFENTEQKTIMIMPGTVFDREFHRIGYGRGYYDHYLEKHSHYTRIAFAYQLQLLQAIPYETHDIGPNMILTECETLIREERTI